MSQSINPEGVHWKLVYTKQAQKDAKKLVASNWKSKAKELLEIPRENPFQNPPPYEKLVGDLSGAYSRRINRLLAEVGKRVRGKGERTNKNPFTFNMSPFPPNKQKLLLQEV